DCLSPLPMYGARSLIVGTSVADLLFSNAQCCLAPSSCRRLLITALDCAVVRTRMRLGIEIDARSNSIAAAAKGTSQALLLGCGSDNCIGVMVLKRAKSFSRRSADSFSGAGCAVGCSAG